jgi:hypothetical protein
VRPTRRLRARATPSPRTHPLIFVIALPTDAALTPAERFALDLLVDLSALLPFDGAGDVVRLRVVGEPSERTAAELGARGWGLTRGEGTIDVDRALLHFVADVGGAEAEQRSSASDRYGRVPAGATRIVREGLERDPIVSIVARSLADAVRAVAGRRPVLVVDPWPDGRHWAAALSHDLDVVAWWPAFTALRLAELARHGELARVAQVLGAATRSIARTPVWSAVQSLLAVEAAYSVRSTWFVLCGQPTLATARAGDLTYRPDSRAARRILDAVRDAGHEIGLHGSFATSDHHVRFAEQRTALRALVGRDVDGVRQHYLRMRAATTPRGMRAAGFAYDSTYGFADRNGFRLGVADVVPLWDAEHQRRVELDEAPFVWMDRALSKYRHIEDPDAWIDDALLLADRCRDVNGMWVGIWHPNLAPALGFPAAPAAYARLVAELTSRGAHVAPIGDLVAWRRARRALRVVSFADDGRVHATGADDAQLARFTIRDRDGNAVSALASR